MGLEEGARYGTILCDLEQRRVIDLLPNRSTETVAAWLHQHPSVQVVSRDRACSFVDAIAKGAPEAVQVADRWDLLNNLVETLGRSFERHRPTIVEVAKRVNHKAQPRSRFRCYRIAAQDDLSDTKLRVAFAPVDSDKVLSRLLHDKSSWTALRCPCHACTGTQPWCGGATSH